MPTDRPVSPKTPWRYAPLLGGKIRYGETFGASAAGPSRYTEFVSAQGGFSRMRGIVGDLEFLAALDRMRRGTP